VLRQLPEAFKWCKQHSIGLEELEVSKHVHEYREASAHLDGIVSRDGLPDEEKLEKLRQALQRLRSDGTRKATRQWVRRPRKRQGQAPRS
jgi:hypothetical protein